MKRKLKTFAKVRIPKNTDALKHYRKIKAFNRRHYKKIELAKDILIFITGFVFGYVAASLMLKFVQQNRPVRQVKVEKRCEIAKPKETAVVGQNTGNSEEWKRGTILLLSGQASYYSTTGCLGCSPNMTMANGEPLDDTKYTVALPQKFFGMLKNETVKVRNIYSGLVVWAKVTDTGGFDKLYRVADLSLATKEMLDCPDLCQVEIYR